MGHYDDPELTGRPRRRPWGALVAVLVALAVGVGAGYLWRDTTAPAVTAAPPPVPAPAPPPAPAPAPADSCVAVAEGGTEVLAQLERAVGAIGGLDPGALRDVVAEVRGLRDQLQRDLDACRGSRVPG